MNKLLEAMASDMQICPYHNEPDNSFVYRVVFSALGQWCLRAASSPTNHIAKRSHTDLLNTLKEKYCDLFPGIESAFEMDAVPVSVFIRRIYEETGYLLTDENNKNCISNYGKGIPVDKGVLYFGISEPAIVSGLGVIIEEPAPSCINWREFLIRDELTWCQFVSKQFDIVLFEKRDIPQEELQFFDPLSSNSPSSSWRTQMKTDWTIARKTDLSQFYKVIKYNNDLLFCEEPQNANPDELTSYEYRRLYFALRKLYNNPLQARIKTLDDNYSELTIGGHLPNREYHLMMLCSWPDQSVENKYKFIVRNQTVSLIKDVLNNLAIEIKGE